MQVADFVLEWTVTVGKLCANGQTVRTKYLHNGAVFLNTCAVDKHTVPRCNDFQTLVIYAVHFKTCYEIVLNARFTGFDFNKQS